MLHNKSFKIALSSFVVTSCLLSIAAMAQVIRNHNSKAPVNFDAGQIELQDRADRVILSGGVVVTQAGLTIRAARLTAAYSRTNKVNVNRLDAIGGVVITKDDLRANASAAIYDLDRDLITLVGNVQLQQGANRLNGGRILIDLNTGRSTINGGAVMPGDPSIPGMAKTSSGRVTGTFTVPQRKN